MSKAYYNENNPYCAQFLRNLISAGRIAPGDVDERDIRDVVPTELKGYTQCHFFAGIGIWSLAARIAGWPDDRKLWTGSCPCQPFSAAGKRAGFADERHLWPAWLHLIDVCKPDVVFGEQVANGDGLTWIDLVHTDMEASSYAFAALDLCSAGFGSPNKRQRLFFVAHSNDSEWRTAGSGRDFRNRAQTGWLQSDCDSTKRGSDGVMADAEGQRWDGCEDTAGIAGRIVLEADGLALGSALGDAIGSGLAFGSKQAIEPGTIRLEGTAVGETSLVRGFWCGADWVLCRDPDGARWRPVEAGTFPLAARNPGDVGALSAYGNAINAEVAAAFIGAYIDEATYWYEDEL